MFEPSSGASSFSSWSPLFRRLLAARKLTEPSEIQKFITSSSDDFIEPCLMKGIPEACGLIRQIIKRREKILVHGDYDVDGVTAAVVAAETLRILGAEFKVFLPDRAVDGYGVSEKAVLGAAADGYKLLITVDCGITAHKTIEEARNQGMDVIIIDHHRIPDAGIPNATVILNPQQSDCPYPFKDLSAAGLAFKLSQALLGSGSFQFLDLAALSTICDVAPLLGENRVIVKAGLEILSSRSRLGLRALMEGAGLKSRELSAGHVGFSIGPRINAAGRMSSPEIAMRLLMTENVKEAESLARILEEENKSRQREERQVVKEAVSQVERIVNFNRDRVIVVAKEGWHPGVIGIVAARLVEKFYRPSLVIALEKGKGKGSGRSIKGFHLFEALADSANFMEQFGGHEQAAGLTIKEENLPELRKKINQFAASSYDGKIFERRPAIDLELDLADFSAVFLRELELLEPHGMGNPRPVFMTRGLEVKIKPEKSGEETLRFWVTDGRLTCEAVWYERSGIPTVPIERGKKLDLAYTVKVKSRDGVETLCLEIKSATAGV